MMPDWFDMILRVGSALLFALLLVYLLLFLFQEKLLFFPPSQVNNPLSDLEITFKTPEGQILHGWYRQAAKSAPLLIYYGGNAEEVSGFMMTRQHFPDWSVLAVNYRGYGLSQGKPSEQALFADALLIYDQMANENTVVMGCSLGSGVATYVAAERQVKGVILVTPYASIIALAQERYPYVPMQWLFKHPFDSLKRAEHIKVPMLGIIASEDEIIAPKHGRQLLAHWQGEVRHVELPGAGHNDVTLYDVYWQEIKQFLEKMEG